MNRNSVPRQCNKVIFFKIEEVMMNWLERQTTTSKYKYHPTIEWTTEIA